MDIVLHGKDTACVLWGDCALSLLWTLDGLVEDSLLEGISIDNRHKIDYDIMILW